MFIAGADTNNSNLSTKTTDANALFLDGTSKVIEVSKTKGNGDAVANSPILNKWFTYTVDKNGVYTLKSIKDGTPGHVFDSDKDKVGQFHQDAANVKIDKKNVSLMGNGSFSVVYGNASSIYLTASTDKVVTGAVEYSVISGVDNVTTGVKNASIETYTYADARKDSGATGAADANTSYGVYTLFKDNGYVIAAVVVGDDAASTKNLVYSINDSVELESYDKAEDEWTWTMKAVDAKGQEITLTEKSDSLFELKKINTKGLWYQVKYDAKGNVVSVEPASTALSAVKKEYITWTDDGSYASKDVVVTFYQVIDGKSYEKDTKTDTLVAGTTHSVTAAAEIKQTGDYYAVIEILDGTKVVAEATTSTVGFAF